jgi:hypothetical protein
VTETAVCLKCGSPIQSGTGFGMVACGQCGEINMLGSQSADVLSLQPLQEMPAPLEQQESPPEQHTPPEQYMAPVPGTGFSEQSEQMNPDFMATRIRAPIPEEEGGGQEEPDLQAATRVLQPDSSPQFKDVAEFGNQDLPATGQGALVYDIKIYGIDTLEFRQQLADCLNDKRLGMDTTELISQIKKGVLRLDQVNPVKAAVLINRLKRLPFKVSWSSQQLIKGLKTILFFIFLSSLSTPALSAEWGRHEVNLKGYATRITNAQEEIQALIVKKNQNRDPQVRDQLLKEIIKKNDDLKRIYKDYKNEKEHVRFEHPEMGDKTERKYRHVKLKSLEDLEGEQGLDGQLSKVKRKVEEQYPSGDKPVEKKPKSVEVKSEAETKPTPRLRTQLPEETPATKLPEKLPEKHE